MLNYYTFLLLFFNNLLDNDVDSGDKQVKESVRTNEGNVQIVQSISSITDAMG